GGVLVGVAPPQVEFPGRLLPPVEPGVADEVEPRRLGDAAELTADQPDLVVAALAVLVGGGLVESHGGEPRWGRGPRPTGGAGRRYRREYRCGARRARSEATSPERERRMTRIRRSRSGLVRYSHDRPGRLRRRDRRRPGRRPAATRLRRLAGGK